MLYHIHCQDKANSLQIRLNTRDAHLSYIDGLGDRLFAAGPLLSNDNEMVGSVLIIYFYSDDDAHAFCAEDPYALAGLFDQVMVSRWRKTLPA